MRVVNLIYKGLAYYFVLVFISLVPNIAIGNTNLDQYELEIWLIEKPEKLITYLTHLPKNKISKKEQEIALTYHAEALLLQDEYIEIQKLVKSCNTTFSSRELNVRVLTVKSYALLLSNKEKQALKCINKAEELFNKGQPQGWEDIWALSVKVLILSKIERQKESKALIVKLYRYIESIPNDFRKANILEPLSMTYGLSFNNPQLALKKYQQVITIYEELQLMNHLSTAYYNQGVLFIENKQDVKALESAKLSYDLAKKTKSTTNLLYSVELIASLYLKSEEYQKGLNIIEQTMQSNIDVPPTLEAYLMYRRAIIAKNIGKKNIHMQSLLKLVELSDQYELKSKNITKARIMLAKLYGEKKRFEKAYNLLLTVVDN